MRCIQKISVVLIIFSFILSSDWVSFDSSASKRFEAKSLSSNIETSDVQFNLKGYTLNPFETPWGIEYKAETEGGASILKSGYPDLDKVVASVIIPDDALMGLEIISSSYIEIENVDISPSKGNFTRNINPKDVPFIKEEVYNEDAFYPGNLAELRDPYILRDFRGQTIVSYPFQYNPVQKVLRIYTEMTVRVTSMGQGRINVLDKDETSAKKMNRDFGSMYSRHFVNFSDTGNSTQDRSGYLVDQGNMLVISDPSFLDEMEPFVQWKNRKGIPTEIFSTSVTGATSTSIKNFVVDYYYDKGLTFLLLVGDAGQIEPIYVNGSASDPSFGFIEGDDSYAEVIVGRFSGNNSAQISTQVERTLEYEQNPPVTSHFNNALGIASDEGGPGQGFEGYTDNQFSEFLWDNYLSDYGYENFEGIYSPNGTVFEGVSAINSGVGIINYTGHASPSSWGNGAPLNVSDVQQLSNQGKLPFIWTVGCNPGEFDMAQDPCFAEAWLRSEDSNGNHIGAIGHFGSTISQSWEPPMHAQWAMNAILTEKFDGETGSGQQNYTRTYGGLAINGCIYMNDVIDGGINETNHWTLFGDPSLLVRTDEPTVLDINPQPIVVGQNEYILETIVDNAHVSISKNGKILSSSYSIGGVAILSLPSSEITPGVVDLVVSSFNAIPYQSSINVISPEGPYIIYNSFELLNPNNVLNPQIESASIVNINLLVQNVGSLNVNPVDVFVSTEDPYITILENDSGYPAGQTFVSYANSGLVRSTEYPITFEIAGNIPDGYYAPFNVSFSADGVSEQLNWQGSFSIKVNAPNFQVSNHSLVDENLDSVVDPGESVVISFDLNNIGSSAFMAYPAAYLTSTSPYITIDNSSNPFWFYGIDQQSSYQAEIQLLVDSDAPLGSNVDFILEWGPSDLSSDWCDSYLCPEVYLYNFSMNIGLLTDSSLSVPQNVVANAQNDGTIYVQWSSSSCEDNQIDDCAGDGDCAPSAWLGDGVCDGIDQPYGYDLTCYDNDGGDCGGTIDQTCEEQGLITCDDGSCSFSIDACSGVGVCSPGEVEDCSESGQCWPDSWIGDGVPDCSVTDQADLTCYDNDGGDCDNRLSFGLDQFLLDTIISKRNYYVQNRFRDIVAFNIFRGGQFIATTNETFYNDADVLGGINYCYSIVAIHENAQSQKSEESCAIIENFLLGDVNSDAIVNVQDIILIVNMILGNINQNSLADLNNDFTINVADIILVINIILDS
ncbi:MAG: hypothetical protein CMG00_03415 [Candidatus Marinimicrobia bacterium]|nr:hypothetical protein [Candidatus Neomarinimicrobiota bacterium]